MSPSDHFHALLVEGPTTQLASAWVRIESALDSTSPPELAEDGPGRFIARIHADSANGARLTLLMDEISAAGVSVCWLESSCFPTMTSRLSRFESGALVYSIEAPWSFFHPDDLDNSAKAAMGDSAALRALASRAMASTTTLSSSRASVAEFISLASCVAKAVESGGESLLLLSEEELLLIADGVQEVRDESDLFEDDYPHHLLRIFERLIVLRRIEEARR